MNEDGCNQVNWSEVLHNGLLKCILDVSGKRHIAF